MNTPELQKAVFNSENGYNFGSQNLKTVIMKIFYNMSEAEFLHWQEEVTQVYDDLRHALVPLNKQNILTEEEASEVLGVTSRTLRNYRHKKYIGYIKMDGRIIYLKHWLYLDLEALYFKSKAKDE